jgi:hypothetical protein
LPPVVYSAFLGSAQGFNSLYPVALFVADGIHRTVIKCMTISVGVNVIPGSAMIQAENFEVLHAVAAQVSDLPMKRTSSSVWGEWVLAPGDRVYALVEGPWTADFYVSGYLLTLP